MGRIAKVEQEARARARARRTKLDEDRAARDERIEAGATSVYLAISERGEARLAAARAEQAMAVGLRAVLAEGVSVLRAAQLCELTVSEVRRLCRPPDRDTGGDTQHVQAAAGQATRQ